MPYVKVKELPESLQKALNECGYRKADVQVLIKEMESVFSSGGNGYRGFASLVNISTGETKLMHGSWGGANPFNPTNQVDLNDNDYTIPKDIAVIRGFSGGASGSTHATVTISPLNILPSLQGGSDVSEEEKRLLAVMRSYTPAYRKPYLDAAKDMVDSLVERGYIKRSKNGALSLTTDGKSAAENIRL